MNRDEILREILSDEELLEKYNISKKSLDSLTSNAPYSKKVIEVLSTIINERDGNKLNNSQVYRKIKNIHKI